LVHFYYDGKERQVFERGMLSLAEKYDEYIQFMTSDRQGAWIHDRHGGLKDVLSVFNPDTRDYSPYRGPSPWKITANEMDAQLVDMKGRVDPESMEKVGDEGRGREKL
jgi:hypothetical protein